MVDRKALLGSLETVAPALSDINLIQQLTYILFTGDHVLAYNDRIAIRTPCVTGLKGAVPGGTLIALLKASMAKEVTFETKDNELHIQAGRGKFKLPFLPYREPKDFPFDLNELELPFNVQPKFPKALLDAVANCMRSVSIDTSVPDQLGVTLIPEKDEIKLFSTNNSTLSHSSLKGKMEQRVILPAQFCEQMLKLCKGDKEVALMITRDRALVTTKGTTLFARFIASKNPLNYSEIVSHHLPKKLELFEIPTGLKNMLERAMIITESAAGRTSTAISISKSDMKLHSKSDKGEVRDLLRVDQKKEVTLSIDPKLVRVGLDKFKNMAVTDGCIIMKDGTHHYLVAAAAQVVS